MRNNYPAFPVQGYPGDGKYPAVKPNSGMSVRDFFAGLALMGYRASGRYNDEVYRVVADMAYRDADAMLERREKQ